MLEDGRSHLGIEVTSALSLLRQWTSFPKHITLLMPPLPKPQLKVGLEIHTQLHTTSKLFSQSKNSTSNLQVKPNTSTSFFDVSLPGTQPKLNFECLLNSIKLALSLNCDISPVSTFDRKHYFYGDQPLGYQITQHFNPIAKNGYFQLFKRHNSKIGNDLKIRIQQLQLEQDTGRSIYHSVNSNISNIDFNRSNLPLVEMVTYPDFSNIEQVRAFLQNYIKLVQTLDVCTGDLETGSLRVDVNINVIGHKRVEIKNLPTISAIINAIRFEENRQINILKEKAAKNENTDDDFIETRGWDGKQTYHLRFKESNIDYRYIPDMELPKIKLDLNDLLPKIQASLPMTIGDRLDLLINEYKLNLRDARVLINNSKLESYFFKCWDSLKAEPKIQTKIINWLNHELLGSLSKSGIEFDEQIIDSGCFVGLLKVVENRQITKSNGKLLLLHLVNNKEDQLKPVLELAKEFDMLASNESNLDIDGLIDRIIDKNPKIINEIKQQGKIKKVNFLIGQCMRQTGGNIQPLVFEEKIKKILNV